MQELKINLTGTPQRQSANRIKLSSEALCILLLVSSAHFFNDSIQSIIPAILPMLKDELALSFAEVGLITLTIQATSCVLQPFIGLYNDVSKRKLPASAPMLFSLVGLMILSQASNFLLILIAVACIGLSSAFFHPESARTAQLAGSSQRGLAQAIFQVGGNFGSAIGPLLAAWIILPNGQRSIIYFSSFVLLAIGALYLSQKLLKSFLRINKDLKEKFSRSAAHTDNTETHISSPDARKILILLLILMLSKQIYVSALSGYLTFFVIDKFALSVQEAQYVLFGFLASGAAGTLLGGPITDRYGRKKVLFGSIVGCAPFSLFIPWAGLTGVVILSMITSFIIASAFSAILVTAIEAYPHRVGLMSGIFLGLSFGIGGVASAILGSLIDLYSLQVVFEWIAVIPLFGFAALFMPKNQNCAD